MRILIVFVLAAYAAAEIAQINERLDNITGNALWTGLLRDCRVPTMSCVQKNVFHYLDDTLSYRGDVSFTDKIRFLQNKVDYTKYTKEANAAAKDDETGRASPLEEVTGALNDKSVKFLMTHDLEMQLPDTLFNGATFKVSPRSFEGDGVLVRLDLIPRPIIEQRSAEVAEGRIFFKKIKKFFKNKLVMAFLSILLILKMLKVKLMFIAPVILGIGTAKKILLKVLLFLFPFLKYLMKLCAYYEHESPTKFHHHHHHISHLGPPHHHHFPDIHVPPHPHLFKHEHDDFEYSGPGLGPEYISNRNTYDQQPGGSENDNEVRPWANKGLRRVHPKGPLTKIQVEQLALQAEREIAARMQLQREQIRLRQENLKMKEQLAQELKIHEQLKNELKLQEQVKIQAMILQHERQQQEKSQAQRIQQPQQEQLQSAAKPPPVFDPFYSPILVKIDNILVNMGYYDEPCRERLICSMYKNPAKFSPNSNLISTELSRDSSELQKPSSHNEAVVRFYKYVQAARDGQDQKDCLRLYPACSVNTELA